MRAVANPVDFEAEGLLEGLEDSDARAKRVELLEDLTADGASLDEIRGAVAADRLALLPVERILGGEKRYTAQEVAEKSGLGADSLEAQRRAAGLPEPAGDERLFDDEDVEAAQLIKQFRDAGFPEEGMLEVTRAMGQGMARTADAMRTLTAQTVVEPGSNERDVGLRLARAAEHMAPIIGPLLEYVLKVHLREVIRSDVVDRALLTSGSLPGSRDATVAFADLVGFTQLGEEISAEELGGVAGRLGALASEVARPPVRLVKMIGDAAMLVSTEPDPLLDATFELIDAVQAEGDGFPRLRAGIAHGPALNRGGDWYGRPVNIASRITAIARPESVLATPELEQAAGDRYAFSRTRRFRIKGVESPIPLLRVRRADPDTPQA